MIEIQHKIEGFGFFSSKSLTLRLYSNQEFLKFVFLVDNQLYNS